MKPTGRGIEVNVNEDTCQLEIFIDGVLSGALGDGDTYTLALSILNATWRRVNGVKPGVRADVPTAPLRLI